MARKKSPPEPTTSRSASPAVRSRAYRVTSIAHPRLVRLLTRLLTQDRHVVDSATTAAFEATFTTASCE